MTLVIRLKCDMRFLALCFHTMALRAVLAEAGGLFRRRQANSSTHNLEQNQSPLVSTVAFSLKSCWRH